MIKSSTFDTLDKSLSHHDFDLPRVAGPALRGRVAEQGYVFRLRNRVVEPGCGAGLPVWVAGPGCVAGLRGRVTYPGCGTGLRGHGNSVIIMFIDYET